MWSECGVKAGAVRIRVDERFRKISGRTLNRSDESPSGSSHSASDRTLSHQKHPFHQPFSSVSSSSLPGAGEAAREFRSDRRGSRGKSA